MGDEEKRKAEEHRKRDEQIIEQIRSSESKVRDEGWRKVDQTYRKPLALILRGFALRCTSAAYEIILDTEVFDDIWQETKTCLCENVQKEEFEFKGNLLAYLVTIAARLTVERWRKERKYVQFPDGPKGLRVCAAKTQHQDSELLNDINRFYDTLNDADQVVLRIGMRLATDNPSIRVSVKVLVQEIQLAGVWGGDYRSISRRYGRLRDKLREFLRKRGHNV